MDNPSIKELNLSPKTEDALSKSSASLIQRIQRKRQDSLTHRRSLSRKSLESKQQSLEISQFYTKMQNKKDILVTTIRQNKQISFLQSPKAIKKRQPTPMLGKGRVINGSSKSPRYQIQKQLELAQFSRRLQDQKQRKVAAERRAETFEKQLRVKIKKIKQLEQELQKLKDNNKQSNNEFFGEDTKSKAISRSGMQRLKANFLQIRIQELQKMNNELSKQLNQTKVQLGKLKLQNNTFKEENQLFKHQIFTLNQQSQSALVALKQREISLLKQKMSLSTSQRQDFLGKLLQQCQQDKLNLQNRIRYLQLKIAFINRKQNEELRDVIKRKDKDIATIRKKLSILANESLRYRKQMQSRRLRQSFLTKCQSRSLRSDSWSLSLSPQRDDNFQ